MGTELLPVITPVVRWIDWGCLQSIWSPPRTDEDAYGCVLWFGWWCLPQLAGALNLFGVSLTKSGMLKFLALGGKIALIAAPIAAIAIAMEDAAKAKKRLDAASASQMIFE